MRGQQSCLAPPPPPSTLMPKDKEQGGREGESPQAKLLCFTTIQRPYKHSGGWKSLQFLLLTPILGSSRKGQGEFCSTALAPSSQPPLQTQLFCSRGEVNLALGPPGWEGLLLHKGKQGLGFRFVPVISCSDPVRLEEGVDFWGLTF